MANKLFHITTAIILVVLLVLLSDPFMLWMPEQAQMAALLGAAILACLWAGFVMYENAADEREVLHKMHAGRIAYLSGIAILTLALIFQGLAHEIDPWVSAALAAMVISKLVARLYLERYR
jgi:putative flippase GtrA